MSLWWSNHLVVLGLNLITPSHIQTVFDHIWVALLVILEPDLIVFGTLYGLVSNWSPIRSIDHLYLFVYKHGLSTTYWSLHWKLITKILDTIYWSLHCLFTMHAKDYLLITNCVCNMMYRSLHCLFTMQGLQSVRYKLH